MGGQTVIQRDGNRADKNQFLKKADAKSCSSGGIILCSNTGITPQKCNRLGIEWSENRFAERDLRILADKLNASQECIPEAKQAKHMLGCISKNMVEYSIPSLCSELVRYTVPGVLCNRELKTRQKKLPYQRNPAEDHRAVKGAEAHAMSGEARGTGFFFSRQNKRGWKKELKDLNIFSYLQGEQIEPGSSQRSTVISQEAEKQVEKNGKREKKYITVRVVKHSEEMLRACKIPFFRDIQRSFWF